MALGPKGMIALIIGGIGSIPGAMVGGFLLGIGENLGILKIQVGCKDGISFALLILFLLFRPGGIFNVKAEPETVLELNDAEYSVDYQGGLN